MANQSLLPKYGPALPSLQGPVSPQYPTLGGVASDRATTPVKNLFSGANVNAPGAGFVNNSASATGTAGINPTIPVDTNAVPAYQPRMTSYNGQAYDLADAGQRQQYYNDVVGSVSNQTNTAYDMNKSNLVAAQGAALGGLNQQQSKLNSDRDNYLRDTTNQGVQFNNDYNSGTAARGQAAFGGSNVFQSGASEGQGYADQQHLRGLSDLQAGTDQYNQQYNQANNQLGLQRNQFNTTYDQNMYQLDNQRATTVQNAKDQLSSNLGYYDSTQNPGITSQDYSSKYNLTPYTPVAAPTVDLGNVNPYASSSTLGGSPTAVGASKFLASPTSSLTPQDQYYGYNPSTSDKNYIQNYFKTGNPNQ